MRIPIVVPELGESIVEARVARWVKREGDRVEVGEPLVELETDKIDLEVGATHAGVLARIAHPAGAEVKVGEVLGEVEEAAAPAQPTGRPAPEEGAQVAASLPASPAAREAAAGPVRDRPHPAPTERAAPARPVDRGRREERVRLSMRRLTIARRLVEAHQTAAMVTTVNDVDMSAVQALRHRYQEGFRARYGVRLGIVSFFVKAVCAALREFPRLNAEIEGDEMVIKHYYDIGIAVGAPEGLVVPVVRDADRLSLGELEVAIEALARKAHDGTLTLDDLSGGTFTITNGGVFGSLLSTPILNPPQVGILGLHRIEDRAVPVAGQVAIRPMMYVALTYDHRLVDGREAVQFLGRVKQLVEDPASLLFDA